MSSFNKYYQVRCLSEFCQQTNTPPDEVLGQLKLYVEQQFSPTQNPPDWSNGGMWTNNNPTLNQNQVSNYQKHSSKASEIMSQLKSGLENMMYSIRNKNTNDPKTNKFLDQVQVAINDFVKKLMSRVKINYSGGQQIQQVGMNDPSMAGYEGQKMRSADTHRPF